MKKIAIIVISILIVISTFLLTLNTLKYSEFQNEIRKKEEKLKNIQKDISKNKEEQNSKEIEYENIKNKNDNKLKEYEKWQGKNEELKKAL